MDSGDPERSTRRAGRGRTWPTRDRAPHKGVTRCIPMRSKAPTGAGMRSCRQTLGRGRSCRGSQWRCQTIAAPMSGRPIPRPHTPHRSGVTVDDTKPIPAPRRVSLASVKVDGESHRRPRGREVVARQRRFLTRFWEFALQTWRSYGSIVVLANLNLNNDQVDYNGFNVATYET